MKINIISVLLGAIFCPLTTFSQIGIYTDNPKSLFHIDVLGNNTGSTPSSSQQLDDVYMGVADNDAVLSLGELPQNDAQLSLTSPNKAFMPNRVSLKSTTDVTTVPNPQEGMMVYNTATVSGINGVLPSIYLFEEGIWKYSFTEDVKRLQMRYLQSEAETPKSTSANYTSVAIMDFGEDIIISEDGAYGIGVSLRGRPKDKRTSPTREIIYVWLMANETPVDVAELNTTGFIDNNYFSYTVFLGGNFNVNDKLTLRISHYQVTNDGEPLIITANETTFMMYWRLSQVSN